MRPGQHRDAEGGGFQQVVPAAAREGAPDEDASGRAEERGEFADGVQQKHAGQGEGVRGGQVRATEEGDAAGGELFRGGGEAFGAARGEDEQEAGVSRSEAEEGVEYGVVLVGVAVERGGHGGGGDPDGGGPERVEKLLNISRDFCGIRIEIVFEISGDFDLFRAHGAVAGGGGGVLGEDEIGEGEDVAEEAAEAEIAGEGAVRDAGVDDEETGAVAAGFAKEVGPDFGFGDDEKRGTEAAEDAAHGKAVVDGGEEDAAGEARQFFFADVASGEGGGGDIDGHAGEGALEAAQERDGGEDFADADGMQPDGSGGGRTEVAREEAEAFGEAGGVAAVAGDAERQIE